MNIRTLIQLTGISLLGFNSFSALAADSCLFESRMDFDIELNLYEQAKRVADDIVGGIKIDDFSMSLSEKKAYFGEEYNLITYCGSENPYIIQSKLIGYNPPSKSINIGGFVVSSEGELRSELEKAIYSISGIDPVTGQLNATLQSACYVSRKLSEMKKYGRDFKIQIETSVLNNNKKVSIIDKNEQFAKPYVLLEITGQGLIMFAGFDDHTVKFVNNFQRINEDKTALYVTESGDKLTFSEYRKSLFYHLIGLMSHRYDMKFAGPVVAVKSALEPPTALSKTEEANQEIQNDNDIVSNPIEIAPSSGLGIIVRSFFSSLFNMSDAS